MTLPFETYVMYTFTYADMPSLSEARYNSHFACKSTFLCVAALM